VMKRVVYLALAAVVALMLLVPIAMAQETMPKAKIEETVKVEREATMPLPPSGGPSAATAGAVLLPAAALLVGSGILVYAIVRRR
jgi:hypothetical protein